MTKWPTCRVLKLAPGRRCNRVIIRQAYIESSANRSRRFRTESRTYAPIHVFHVETYLSLPGSGRTDDAVTKRSATRESTYHNNGQKSVRHLPQIVKRRTRRATARSQHKHSPNTRDLRGGQRVCTHVPVFVSSRLDKTFRPLLKYIFGHYVTTCFSVQVVAFTRLSVLMSRVNIRRYSPYERV